MATFSIGDALGSGFRLIARKPFSVLFWGLAYLVLAVGPIMVLLAYSGPDFITALREMAKNAQSMAPHPGAQLVSPPVFHMPSQLFLWQPVAFLSGLAARGVLTGAVFRAVLEPRKGGFAYLRLGAQEFWLALLMLASGILAVILMMLFIFGGVAAGAAMAAVMTAQHVAQTWIVLSEVVLGVVLCAVFIGVCVRFSLAGPLTYADKEFRLFESWKLTKGNGWKLFGLGLLLAIVAVILVMLFEGAVFGVTMATVGSFKPQPAQIEAFFRQPVDVWAKAIWPWAAGALLVCSFVTGAMSAITLAPWAAAFKKLKAGGGDSAAAAAATADHGHDGHGGAALAAGAAALGAAALAAGHGHGDAHGHDSHGHDDHGHGNGHDAHGHDAHGHDAHGHDAHGHDDHGHGGGHEAHGHDAHGHDAHGHGNGHDAHGHDAHGHDAHGHDDHGHGGGHGDHGHDAHGHDAHGHDAHGHDDHGHGGGHGHDDHGHAAHH